MGAPALVASGVTTLATLVPKSMWDDAALQLSRVSKATIVAGEGMWDSVKAAVMSNKLNTATLLITLADFLPDGAADTLRNMVGDDVGLNRALDVVAKRHENRAKFYAHLAQETTPIPAEEQGVTPDVSSTIDAFRAEQERLYDLGLTLFLTEDRMRDVLEFVHGFNPMWLQRRRTAGYK